MPPTVTQPNENNIAQNTTTYRKTGVGFATLPNQIHAKAIRRGFEFSLMVCGESGLGKSTMLNSLFLTDIYCDSYPGPSKRITKTLAVSETDVQLQEAGVNLTLTVIDTPGYGEKMDNSDAWYAVSAFIEEKFEKYLNDESRVNRKTIRQDKRVHACLYFIAPSGHGMKALDVEFMRRLHDKVNIIPVIAKADSMTPDEIVQFKKSILQEIHENQINIYQFPDINGIVDYQNFKNRPPFAVIGSNYILEVDGKRLRARQYPWGFAEIENDSHCDFSRLRRMLLCDCMQDLIDSTAVHYEWYRQAKLSILSPLISDENCNISENKINKNPLEQIEEEKRSNKIRMIQMEKEMEQVFQSKVAEKRERLKKSEKELQYRHDACKKKMETEWEMLNSRIERFEATKKQWELDNKVHLDKMKKKNEKMKK